MPGKADWFLAEAKRRMASAKDEEKGRVLDELRLEIQRDLDSGKRSDLVEGLRDLLLGSGVVEPIRSK